MKKGTCIQADVRQDDPRILYLSWEMLGHLITMLVTTIHADGPPEILVGIQRGGLIPAVMLSHQLGTPTVLSLPIRSTTSDAVYASKVAPVAIAHDLLEQVRGRDLLVVDDIVGSGATLRAALHLLHRYEPARIRSATCLLNRAHWDPVNNREPARTLAYVGQEIRGWVIFPWEKNDVSTPPIIPETAFSSVCSFLGNEKR